MALFTLHPLSVTLATTFSILLVTLLTGVEMLDAVRERRAVTVDATLPRP